ncbi:MAG: glycerol-3-phosphate dehydrogenase [Alphaproteobacteria bacterium]|nr:glycerol-3-phosphate dehydrogenase [Alphaproteobacteria bacterium]
MSETSATTSAREGSLDAPTRHPLDWQSPDFLDAEKIDAEMRRVFDICHGCRRCFNLCDSFPRLFDLIDDSPTGELDAVSSEDFGPVVEACTLCDMCFMTKCPYVPPHEFNLDFPHLMLRYRAAEMAGGKKAFTERQLGEMDRNGRLAAPLAGLVNWGADRKNKTVRTLMEKTAGIDARAELPAFAAKPFLARAREGALEVNRQAPAFGRKVALFATCSVNYNRVEVGEAARKVLAHNGVETRVAYPGCCGMPFLEQADLPRVAEQARKVSAELRPLIEEGLEIITLTASCGLMFKFEWPLALPDNEDVKRLSGATRDIDELIVDIARTEGLAPRLRPLETGVAVHLACHARAQNKGPKAAEMLRLIPDTPVTIIERCSGHGGTFGVMKGTHDIAMKVGKPAMRSALKTGHGYLVSDCPLAAKHLVQGMGELAEAGATLPEKGHHPIELMALSYGLV